MKLLLLHLHVQLHIPAPDIEMPLTVAFILALSVGYSARLYQRRDFEEKLAEKMELVGGVAVLRNEIRLYVLSEENNACLLCLLV